MVVLFVYDFVVVGCGVYFVVGKVLEDWSCVGRCIDLFCVDFCIVVCGCGRFVVEDCVMYL